MIDRSAKHSERVRTAEAARITGLHARTLQEKAAAGLIPGAKNVFGRWTYDVRALKCLGHTPQMQASPRLIHTAPVRIIRADAARIHVAYERVLSKRTTKPEIGHD